MIPFRRILFPVDFSQSNRSMAKEVRRMADFHDSSITVLHALPPSPAEYGVFANASVGWPDLAESAGKLLDEFIHAAFSGRKVERHLETGDAAKVIHNYVRHNGTDLIMMPTSGAGGLQRFLLGSTTATVLHDVSCAVMTGTHELLTDRESVFPYQSIAVCVDSDEEAQTLVRGAAALASSFGAKLTAIHVVSVPTPSPRLDLAHYRRDILAAATQYLRELIARAEAKADYIAVEGNPPQQIREEVLRIGADLMVVGRGHAQQRIGRLLSGLYSVVRESPCPVLSL